MYRKLRNEINRTREVFNDLVGKHVHIPLGICIVYYFIMLPIGLLLGILTQFYITINLHRILKRKTE